MSVPWFDFQVVDAEQAIEPLNFLHYLQTSLGDHDQTTPTLDNFKDRQVCSQVVQWGKS